MRHLLLTVAAILGLNGCAAVEPSPPATYSNPVLDADFPDPASLKAPDGFHYAYYLYYSAKPDAALTDESRGLCLAVATSDRPEGPFRDIGRPLQCGPGFVNIDPMAYDDPATGKRLLYWGSGFGPIKVQELAPDRLSFAPRSAPIDLIPVVKSEDPNEYQRLIEGAWVIRRGDYYYLFYSGDNCCGPKAHYAVMVARSRSATGPFETRAAATGAPTSVILEREGLWVAPGHNAIVQDAKGDDWMLYHAVDSRRPRSKPGDDVNTRRIMLLDRIVWKDGWPRVDAMICSIASCAASALPDSIAASTLWCAGRLAVRPWKRLVKRIEVWSAVVTRSRNCM